MSRLPLPRPTFGQQLKQHRTSQGLTVEDIAQLTGLTKGFVSQVENEHAALSVRTLKSFVHVYIMLRKDLDENAKLVSVWELVMTLLAIDLQRRPLMQALRLIQSGVHLHIGRCGCTSRAPKK